MARLVYIANTSIDGYVEDPEGNVDFGEPSEEVFRFINELERPIGTYLFGRRMYETMLYWETAPTDQSVPDFVREFTELWHAADKVVFSTTLDTVSSAKTRLERRFDPEEVRRHKASSDRDLTVGGAELAGRALAAGLVDELCQLVVPVVLGGGKPWLSAGLRIDVELVDTRRFDSGVVCLRYRPTGAG